MIKFRAWDKDEHEYFIDGSAGTLFNLVCCDDLSMMIPDNYIWEQFTGLKDVNGKEIYIGDIVKYRNLDEKYQYLKIRWLQQDCMVDAGGYRIDIVARRCEVIGNVHTNPELLEEDK